MHGAGLSIAHKAESHGGAGSERHPTDDLIRTGVKTEPRVNEIKKLAYLDGLY